MGNAWKHVSKVDVGFSAYVKNGHKNCHKTVSFNVPIYTVWKISNKSQTAETKVCLATKTLKIVESKFEKNL